MQKKGMWVIGLIVLCVMSVGTPLHAQEEKMSKPPMYIYVSQWAVPRAQWGEMAKLGQATRALEDKLVADGTITGYGEYETLIHTEGMPTHGSWLTSNSEAGILKAIDAFMSQSGSTAPVLAASKHWDMYLASRIYNSRSGTFDNAYLSGTTWEIKPGQFHAFTQIFKDRVVPMLEKELSQGVLISYNMNYQQYATGSPDTVEVDSIVPNASDVDKMDKAFEGLFGKDPEIGPAMGSIVKFGSRRDFLLKVNHMVIK